jgi:hypothetical protein
VIGGVFYFLTSYRAEKEKTEGKKPRIGLRRKNGRKKIEGLHGEKPKETKGTKTAWGKTEGNQRNKDCMGKNRRKPKEQNRKRNQKEPQRINREEKTEGLHGKRRRKSKEQNQKRKPQRREKTEETNQT